MAVDPTPAEEVRKREGEVEGKRTSMRGGRGEVKGVLGESDPSETSGVNKFSCKYVLES